MLIDGCDMLIDGRRILRDDSFTFEQCDAVSRFACGDYRLQQLNIIWQFEVIRAHVWSTFMIPKMFRLFPSLHHLFQKRKRPPRMSMVVNEGYVFHFEFPLTTMSQQLSEPCSTPVADNACDASRCQGRSRPAATPVHPRESRNAANSRSCLMASMRRRMMMC